MTEIILGSLLAGALIASLGLAAYLEYKRYRLYRDMIVERSRYYRDGCIFFRSKTNGGND